MAVPTGMAIAVGRGSSSGHDWGAIHASASGIPCPQCKTINPQAPALRPVRDIAGASIVHEAQ